MPNIGKAIASMAPYVQKGFEGYAAQKQKEAEDALLQQKMQIAQEQQAVENELEKRKANAIIENYTADNDRLKLQTEALNELHNQQVADKLKNAEAERYYGEKSSRIPEILAKINLPEGGGNTADLMRLNAGNMSPSFSMLTEKNVSPIRVGFDTPKNEYAKLKGLDTREKMPLLGMALSDKFVGTPAQKEFQSGFEKYAPNLPVPRDESLANRRFDVSIDNSDKQAYERLTGEAKKDVQAARGQFGKMFDVSMRANRDMALIDRIKEGLASGDPARIKATNQSFRELTTGLNNVIGGSAAVSQIDDLTAKSYMMEMNELVQKMQNKPVDAVPVEWLDHLKHSFEAISNYNASKYKEIMDFYKERGNTILSGTDYIDPFNRDIDKLTNLPTYKLPKKESAGALPDDKAKRLEELRRKKAAGTLGQ